MDQPDYERIATLERQLFGQATTIPVAFAIRAGRSTRWRHGLICAMRQPDTVRDHAGKRCVCSGCGLVEHDWPEGTTLPCPVQHGWV